MTLTVAAVARRLGVAPATLRTWDRRYGLGPSEHTAGAHRRYSASDLARLVVMRRLTLEGVSPAEAAQLAATTAVAGGGFALASVSTIPTAVIEAAVTDAAAIAGPTSGLLPPGASGPEGPDAVRPDESEDAESRPSPALPGADAPGRAAVDDEDWAVASLSDRFADEVRVRGVARAWDEVLGPASAARDAAMHAAVARALSALPTADGERAVLLAGAGTADDRDRTPVLLAAAAALAERGAGARSVGDGVPARMLAAAVRRVRPPALLLVAPGATSREDVLPELADLLRVRPAPLLVVLGGPDLVADLQRVREEAAGPERDLVPVAGLTEAVAACVGAVSS
ncbi:MerR family transcriptional regulator [Kineococcus mangrovi]